MSSHNKISSDVRVNLNQRQPVTWVKLVRHKWLIAASSDSSTSVLSLWSLDALLEKHSENPSPISQWFLSGPVRNGAADIRDDRVVLAVELWTHQPSIEILMLCAGEDGSPVFSRRAVLRGAAYLRSLHGLRVTFALYNDLNVPCIWNWESDDVKKVCSSPSIEGGSLAMVANECLLVSVNRRRIEAFLVDGSNTTAESSRHGLVVFEKPVVSASVNFSNERAKDDSAKPLQYVVHVSTQGREGISFYEICFTLPQHDSGSSLRWTLLHTVISRPVKETVKAPTQCLVASPVLSSTKSVSWLLSRLEASSRSTMTIVHSRLPTESSSDAMPAWFEFEEPDVPALYFLSVRHFDDDLGLLVVANGFGEMAVYKYGGVSLRQAAASSSDIKLPPPYGRVLLSRTPIPSHPAPPFPYSGPRYLSGPPLDALLASWKARRPPAPSGWHQDWADAGAGDSTLGRWIHFVPFLGRQAHLYEEWGFYGTPLPLFHEAGDVMLERVVFKMGGLYFVQVFEPDTGLVVVPPGVELEDLVERLQTEIFPFPRIIETGNYHESLNWWIYEFEVLGRNRWAELKERGGEVHPDWFEREREGDWLADAI